MIGLPRTISTCWIRVEKPPRNLPLPEGAELEEGVAAIAEAAAVAGGLDLSSRSDLNKINKLLRLDAMDGHVHRILVIGLYFVGICIAGLFGSLAWNMGASEGYRFLEPPQMAVLQGFLFSGAMGSAVTAAARKVAEGNKEDKSED